MPSWLMMVRGESFSPNHRRMMLGDERFLAKKRGGRHSCLAKGVQVCELELPNLDPGMMSPMMSRDKFSPGTRSWVGTNTKVFNPVGFLILHDEVLRMKNRNENSKRPKPDYDHSF